MLQGESATTKGIKCFMKELGELTTLCGVMACAYVQAPEIWPNKAEASRVLTRFESCNPAEQTRRCWL
ncbi:hypothetical protein FRX31_007928 [Thalictrum thalictroides]|uniref:Uncharacterized protein n=1 Tax=Thalictrum thalictroides TaxID=46969 RepID=A0A7J6X0Y2_THATH|nr:hypothetical protein FRX31_007928 [Thalictrum thalictroides]